MSDFSARVETFLAEFFLRNPTFATAIGEHRHDERWPDLTAAGRAERLAFGERWLAEFGAMTDLSPDEVIDRDSDPRAVVGDGTAPGFGTVVEIRGIWHQADISATCAVADMDLYANTKCCLAAAATAAASILFTVGNFSASMDDAAFFNCCVAECCTV